MAKFHLPSVTRMSSLTYRPELDGLRAIAIIAVVLCHLELFGYGSHGVDIFFVLSGYLITDVLLKLQLKENALKIFWVGRLARLTPILIINVVIGSLLSYFFLRSTFHIAQPLSALLYVKNFFIASPKFHDVWAPTWTLGSEEQFYLVWPLVIFFLAKRIPIKTFIFIVVVYFFAVHELLNMAEYLLGLQNPPAAVSANSAGKIVQVIIRPSEILLGALITLHRKMPSGRPIVLYFTAGYLFAISLDVESSTKIAILSGLLLSFLELEILPSKILRRILSFRLLVVLGILSYSIYLWHVLIFELLFEHFAKNILVEFLAVIFTMSISYISYVYIELPLQKLIRKRFLNGAKT